MAQFKTTSYAVNLTVEEVDILIEALRVLSTHWDDSIFFLGDVPPYEVDALLESFKKAVS